jgi:hypothetical protein
MDNLDLEAIDRILGDIDSDRGKLVSVGILMLNYIHRLRAAHAPEAKGEAPEIPDAAKLVEEFEQAVKNYRDRAATVNYCKMLIHKKALLEFIAGPRGTARSQEAVEAARELRIACNTCESHGGEEVSIDYIRPRLDIIQAALQPTPDSQGEG